MDSKNLRPLDAAEATARLARYLREKGLAADEATSLSDAYAILFGPDGDEHHHHH
jgi:hypothetical protein